MLGLIKSYFIPKETRLVLVAELMSNPYGYTCERVYDYYPRHIHIWYRRQVIDYAKRHKANLNTPFSYYKQNGLAYRNKTTPNHERLIFLEELKDTLSWDSQAQL